mmetsp:Transcript_35841/g.111344  ORF Transcript_35841/g.111344 Transcript_35841/m.111344 type:complete len:390 (+) Transcript_35841:335-1504(+)
MASWRSGQASPPGPASHASRAGESSTARAACEGRTSVADGWHALGAAWKPPAASRPASLERMKHWRVPSCSPNVQKAHRDITAQARAQSSALGASNLSVRVQSPAQQPLAESPNIAVTSSKLAYTPFPRKTTPCSTHCGQAAGLAGASTAASMPCSAPGGGIASSAGGCELMQACLASSVALAVASAAASSTDLLQLSQRASRSESQAARASENWPETAWSSSRSFSPSLSALASEASSLLRSSASGSSQDGSGARPAPPSVGHSAAGHSGQGGGPGQAGHLGHVGRAAAGSLGSSAPSAASTSPSCRGSRASAAPAQPPTPSSTPNRRNGKRLRPAALSAAEAGSPLGGAAPSSPSAGEGEAEATALGPVPLVARDFGIARGGALAPH